MLLLVKRRIRVEMRGIGVEMRRVGLGGGEGGENVGNRAGMR